MQQKSAPDARSLCDPQLERKGDIRDLSTKFACFFVKCVNGTLLQVASSSVEQSEKIISLQKQNEELRQVIKQMRLDMELLGDQLPSTDTQRKLEGNGRLIICLH